MTGETQAQVKDDKRSETRIVSYILRDPQFVTLALDKGFKPDMLSSASLRFLASMSVKHVDLYSGNLDYETVERELQDMEQNGRIDDETSESFLAAYERAQERSSKLSQVKQSDFLSLLDHYMNSRRHEKMVEGMVDIVEGSCGDFGQVRDNVNTLLAELDDLADGRPPEGDILSSKWVKNAARRHKQAKEDPDSAVGTLTGIEQWDSVLHGFRQGEAWIVAGYVGEGKSMTCLQLAYSAAYEQGKNVVFISTEMQIENLQDLIYARHSLTVNKEQCIANDGELGFEHEDLSMGRLEGDTAKLFKVTVEDIQHGRQTGRYGKLYVFGTKASDTVQTLRVKCQMLRQQFPIDIIIIDYATLLAPRRPRNSKTEEMAEIMRDIKQLALNFNNGEGARVVTAHQSSRKGRDEAIKRGGYYLLSDLADTSGAERNMDGVLWVLRDEDNKERSTAWLGCAKNRRGALPSRFEVRVNYAYAAFHAAQYTQEPDDIDDDFRSAG